MATVSGHVKHICRRPLLLSRMLSVTPKTLSEDAVLFETRNNCGIITLNRPKVLNTISLPMIRMIHPVLKEWDEDPRIGVILIKGSGEKAFCAGGDVVSLFSAGGPFQLSEEVFKELFQLVFEIANIRTPYVAFMHGITMGGGVSLSIHGRYRVATEKTLFAMPETAIGVVPVPGGGFFLPRLRGSLGVFLGLSGNRLKGRDNYCAGIATHYVSTRELPYLYEEICNLQTPSVDKVAELLDYYYEKCEDKEHEFSLQQNMDAINSIFSLDTVESILEGLEKEGSDWSNKQMEILKKMSPTALKVTLEQLKQGESLSLKAVLQMEYRISQHLMEGSDFCEGVRAMLIDRDNNPMWQPSCLGDVSVDMVSSDFARLPDDKELVLPE